MATATATTGEKPMFKAFDKHPNIQRLASIVRENTSTTPQPLSTITAKVLERTGNKMNFRRTRIVRAVLCVLHQLPEIQINKNNPSEPLYYKK